MGDPILQMVEADVLKAATTRTPSPNSACASTPLPAVGNVHGANVRGSSGTVTRPGSCPAASFTDWIAWCAAQGTLSTTRSAWAAASTLLRPTIAPSPRTSLLIRFRCRAVRHRASQSPPGNRSAPSASPAGALLARTTQHRHCHDVHSRLTRQRVISLLRKHLLDKMVVAFPNFGRIGARRLGNRSFASVNRRRSRIRTPGHDGRRDHRRPKPNRICHGALPAVSGVNGR